MQTPVNPLKQALAEGRPQIGFWMAMANPITAEICAGAGFDWLLIDGEHSPQTLPLVLAQLQAIAAYPGCHAIVRVPSSDPVTLEGAVDSSLPAPPAGALPGESRPLRRRRAPWRRAGADGQECQPRTALPLLGVHRHIQRRGMKDAKSVFSIKKNALISKTSLS